MSIRTTIRTLSLFFIGRYPFVNALTLLMLLAERADREKYPPIEPRIIYGHLVAFVICGVSMGFNIFRKNGCLMHVGQLLYLAFSIYTSENMHYRQWVLIRMASRLVGVAGVVLLYAYFTSEKPRSPQLKRFGETLVGLYVMGLTYAIVESPEDRQAFNSHVFGGEYSLYIFAILLATVALCFLPGLFVHDAAQLLLLLLVVYTTVVDCDFNYWTRKRGMDFWNQFRLITDHGCIILGCMMIITCTVKKIYTKED